MNKLPMTHTKKKQSLIYLENQVLLAKTYINRIINMGHKVK